MWLWNSWESSIRATSVTGSFDWVNFPDVSSDPEFLKIFAPYFSSEIVEGKHGIVFLRGYQTVVDLKKKDRKLNLDLTENSENTAETVEFTV